VCPISDVDIVINSVSSCFLSSLSRSINSLILKRLHKDTYKVKVLCIVESSIYNYCVVVVVAKSNNIEWEQEGNEVMINKD